MKTIVELIDEWKVLDKELWLDGIIRREVVNNLYDSLIIFNSSEKHESGFYCFVVIGCVGGEVVEVISDSSDLLTFQNSEIYRVEALTQDGVCNYWSPMKKLQAAGYSTLIITGVEIEK